MHLEANAPVLSILVVIMPNLHDWMKLTRSSTFSLSAGSLLFSALYGSAGFEPVSVLLKDIVEDEAFLLENGYDNLLLYLFRLEGYWVSLGLL